MCLNLRAYTTHIIIFHSAFIKPRPRYGKGARVEALGNIVKGCFTLNFIGMKNLM